MGSMTDDEYKELECSAKALLECHLGPEESDEDEDACPTCLEPYTSDNPKIFARCGHHFHMQCIYSWLERKDTCPICESKMTFEELL